MSRRVGAKAKIDTRGPFKRLLDAERTAREQGKLNVLTDAQFALEVMPLAFNDADTPEERATMVREVYGNELHLYAPDGGRRHFRLQHLDRLHKNKKLTYEQHQAGKWYRERWEAGRYDCPRTQDLTRPRGENVVEINIPTAAQRARDDWRAARKEWPEGMVGFMDRFLLRDSFPKRHHRAAMRQLSDIRRSLDAMAAYLRLG